MKLTKTQIVLGSLGIAAVGATLFFTLTKKGKELREKWFGKKETTEPEGDVKTDTTELTGDTKTDTTKTDVPPQNTGIVPPKRKPIPVYAKKALTPIYDLNVLTEKTITTPIRLAGSGEDLGTFVKIKKSFWGNKYVLVDVSKGITRVVALENVSLKS